MKLTFAVLTSLLAFSSTSLAAETCVSPATIAKSNCYSVAVQALAKKLKVPESELTSLGSTSTGDGAAVVDVNVFSVVEKSVKPGRHDKYIGSYTVIIQNDSADTCEATVADAKILKLAD